MKIPFFNRSSREYLGSDIYNDSQQLTDRKDDYEGFQEDLKPETYRDKKRLQFIFTSFYRLIFPYLSGITLLFLVVFLSFNIDQVIREGLTLKSGIIGGISLLMCVALVGLNELVKTRSLSDYFKDVAKRIRPDSRLLTQAVITSCISIIGSGAGLYLLVYQINDNSHQIEQGASQSEATALTSWQADSIRITALYLPSIQQKRESISRYNPKKYRTLRDKLNNEAIALSNKMQSELSVAKAERQNRQSEISAKRLSELQQNEDTAGGNAWIACIFILLGEMLNIISHRFCWIYKARSAREGIEFGAIEASEEKTAYEIQLQRLGAFLHGQNVNQVQVLPGPGQAGTAQKQPGQPGKIGFQQKKPASKGKNSDLDFAGFLDEIRGIIREVKKEKSAKQNSPEKPGVEKGENSTHLHTHQREIFLDNSHPKFSTHVQPDKIRGIDERKYKRFVKAAMKVKTEKGRYNKSAIQRATGIRYDTVTKYLKVAIEMRKDLTP